MRGKLRAALQKSRPDLVLPDAAWSKPWVVHCTTWGEGEQAVLDYLARYVFRVAVTNTRIVAVDDQAVTIRHKHRKSNRGRTSRIPGLEFMRRFLQHVLPKGLLAPVCCFCSTGRRRNLAARSGGRRRSIDQPENVGRSAGLSLLPQRPPPVRPPTLPEAGPRTMTPQLCRPRRPQIVLACDRPFDASAQPPIRLARRRQTPALSARNEDHWPRARKLEGATATTGKPGAFNLFSVVAPCGRLYGLSADEERIHFRRAEIPVRQHPHELPGLELCSRAVCARRGNPRRSEQAAVEDAKSQIRDAQFDVDHCRITAPFTGVSARISSRSAT